MKLGLLVFRFLTAISLYSDFQQISTSNKSTQYSKPIKQYIILVRKTLDIYCKIGKFGQAAVSLDVTKTILMVGRD
jgi:hypothetical protein